MLNLSKLKQKGKMALWMAASVLRSLVLPLFLFICTVFSSQSLRPHTPGGQDFSTSENPQVKLFLNSSLNQKDLPSFWLEEQRLSMGFAGHADGGSEPERSLN